MNFEKNYKVQFPTRVSWQENQLCEFKWKNRLWRRISLSRLIYNIILPIAWLMLCYLCFRVDICHHMSCQTLRKLETEGNIEMWMDSHAALKTLEALPSSSSSLYSMWVKTVKIIVYKKTCELLIGHTKPTQQDVDDVHSILKRLLKDVVTKCDHSQCSFVSDKRLTTYSISSSYTNTN